MRQKAGQDWNDYDETLLGIYAVQVDDDRVLMVLATSAVQATELAATHVGANPKVDAVTYTVGRVGDYSPGMMGQRMMAASGGVIG